ncbi:MAG: NAD(P)/FAD-dependent oxidoreductase [Thermoplasmatales archaeon]|nr:NAD(P)/FAD-dependent oxidoreductase [Thermoplasmatales archaeon]
MTRKTYETIIIGAGISGLACARSLQEKDRDFLIIGEDVGGRILTSADGSANYGAFFVCSDYHHLLQYVKIKSRIKLSNFCFHEEKKTYVFFEPKLIKYSVQFVKALKLLYKFRKAFHKFRKNSEIISQKNAIENDPFLYELYMQNAPDFVKKQKIQKGTDTYLSKALYSTTFSMINEMNAFSFLQFLLPMITPIYTFTFEKEKMIQPFQEKMICGYVDDVIYKNGQHKVKADGNTFYADNIVLATQIDWSKHFAGVKKTNKPASTNMLHVKGVPKSIVARKEYQLFAPPSNVQAMANLKDGTYLFYYRYERPSLENFFKDPHIIAHKYWNPAGTINGHALIECNRGNNMYLIGDFNVCGLEESYITGIYAANQIINSG